MILITDYL